MESPSVLCDAGSPLIILVPAACFILGALGGMVFTMIVARRG